MYLPAKIYFFRSSTITSDNFFIVSDMYLDDVGIL